MKNEVDELSIKFSKLKLESEDEENDDNDLKKYVKNATDLNVGKNKLKRKLRSPANNGKSQKKIKIIKPVQKKDKIQRFDSILKDPPQRIYRPSRKIKRIDIIDFTLSDDEEQGYRPSSKIKPNDIIDLTLSDDEEPPTKKR